MGIDAEMFVRVRPPLSDAEVRSLSWEMCGAIGHRNFCLDREDDRHALESVDVFFQDGPELRPEPGEQFVRVHLWTRFYGVGYERGDLPLILTVAWWLEMRIPFLKGNPTAEVWYGGDSSGVCAEPFGSKERLALFDHFVRVGHRPYVGTGTTADDMARHCSFCDKPMIRFGWGAGGSWGSFACHGCGLAEETSDGGKTWAPRPVQP